jgi:asparagine N-glycosylation enzyme membrane subunit Stt3
MRDVVTLAIVLIVLAVLMGALGVFVQGAHILLWLGIAAAIAAVVLYLVNGTPRRGGPPL